MGLVVDQGSVVVLCRRVFLSAEIPDHPDMDHDLNYSGSIPTATTLIPDLRVCLIYLKNTWFPGTRPV